MEMAKLTKVESKAHNKALDLVYSDKQLTFDEKNFVIENYHEGGCVDNTRLSAHFTPVHLAGELSIEVYGPRVLDLCAGIGRLAFEWFHRRCHDRTRPEVTCVEYNSGYVEVGRRVLPEAHWICGDVFDAEIRRELAQQHFDTAISNPPFGTNAAIKGRAPHYTGSQFEYAVIDVASELADFGAFIIPQGITPFIYSGARCYSHYRDTRPEPSAKAHHSRVRSGYEKFHGETCIDLTMGCGIDTSIFAEQWRGVRPVVEIVTADFTEARAERARAQEHQREHTPVAMPLLDLMAA